jgi:universal stress protein E
VIKLYASDVAMLKSIIAASDLSSRSKPAVGRAVQLAQASGATLGILHVVEDDQPEARMLEEMRSAEAFLEEQVATFGKPKDCEVLIRAGDAFHVISEVARERAADVIVVGAHRRQFPRDAFAGTTIERITRTAGRPVLMATTGELWKKVVIAIDLSETSAEAARTAHALGMLDGAEVIFVHAYAPITRQMMTYAGVAQDRVSEDAEREFQATRREVADFIQGLGLDNLSYGARIVEGLGTAGITGAVKQSKPDLLVIGTRGLSGAKRLFLGSVAQQLMGSLDLDILAVPPKE